MDRDLFLTDSDIHCLEEDSEVVKLRNERDELEQKLNDKKDTIRFIKEKIEHDIKVNERCLEEKTNVEIAQILNIQIKFDKELLEIINEE